MSKRMIFVKITTDDQISVVETKGTQGHTYAAACELLGIDMVEHVITQRMVDVFGDKYSMFVDEMGHYKSLPINLYGSYLYAMDKHGSAIVGDILIAKDIMTDEGPDIDALTELDAKHVVKSLDKLAPMMKVARGRLSKL